jgi:hypothetical protein
VQYKRYAIRLDDIHAGSDQGFYDEMFQSFGEALVIFGVVPESTDPELSVGCKWSESWVYKLKALSKLPNVLIAQHGTHHKLYETNNNLQAFRRLSEFSGQSYDQQRSLIEKGRAFFEENEIEVSGFMPPAHGYDDNTIKAVADIGYRFFFDGLYFAPYRKFGLIFVPCLNEKIFHLPWPFRLTTCYHLEKDFSPHEIRKWAQLGSMHLCPSFYVPTIEKLMSWLIKGIRENANR